MKEKRFEVVFSQGTMDVVRILVDQVTGVNYLQVCNEIGRASCRERV